MRKFKNGDVLHLEPWRAKAFPVLQDLMVDRSAFDRVQASGGFCSVHTGSAVDANAMLVPKDNAEAAFDAATCIGCGACVAACKNASAMLFVAAKVGHLRHLPQGQTEQARRAEAMVARMDAEGFGACSNTYDCEAACPKEISVDFIAELNRDVRRATLAGRGRFD
jgi:succinate dehydrogenase / fumarate reductase iron-sulfur subunit